MSRTGTPERTGQQSATRGYSRRLPEVSAQERDFWRRAVALERERLELGKLCTGGMGAAAALLPPRVE
jgi:hypothetical protein